MDNQIEFFFFSLSERLFFFFVLFCVFVCSEDVDVSHCYSLPHAMCDVCLDVLSRILVCFAVFSGCGDVFDSLCALRLSAPLRE